jgi:hypothetical protein
VAFEITNGSDECSASIIRVIRIGELNLLFTANVVRISLIPFALMMEAIPSY